MHLNLLFAFFRSVVELRISNDAFFNESNEVNEVNEENIESAF